MHRDVHPGIAVAEGFQRLRQNVGGERRHRGDRDFAALQGKALAHRLLNVIPVGQQLTGHRQKEFPLLGEGHFAGAALQQGAPQRLLQPFDGQAERWLRQIQPFAGVGEIESVSYR